MKKLSGGLYLVRRLRERGNPVPPWWKLRGIVNRDGAVTPDPREPRFHRQTGSPSLPATG